MDNLKYLAIPSKVNFNLNLGDDKYVPKPDSCSNEKIKHLLTFIKNQQQTLSFDFVCFRGLLRLLMSTPYDQRESWIVLATKFKGCIFLCAEETPQKQAQKQRETERDKKFMRYGFKFESYILSDHPSKSAPGNTQPVLEAEEFCVMFSSSIDGKKILYGAETDGVIKNQPVTNLEELKRCRLVEVKVKRREINERQVTNFYKFKSRNWWLQSFLVGIDNIHVGMRDDDGYVDEVTSISTKELSDEAKKNNYWHGTVCVNFLNDFLNKVSNDLKNIDNPQLVLRYQWNQSKSDYVSSDKLQGSYEGFLPQDFVSFMRNT